MARATAALLRELIVSVNCGEVSEQVALARSLVDISFQAVSVKRFRFSMITLRGGVRINDLDVPGQVRMSVRPNRREVDRLDQRPKERRGKVGQRTEGPDIGLQVASSGVISRSLAIRADNREV